MNVLDRIKHLLKDAELGSLIMEVLNYDGNAR